MQTIHRDEFLVAFKELICLNVTIKVTFKQWIIIKMFIFDLHELTY